MHIVKLFSLIGSLEKCMHYILLKACFLSIAVFPLIMDVLVINEVEMNVN